MSERTEKRVEKFISDPKKSLLKLALPIVVGMLVQTLYNIVDTAFVGRLGGESIAALTYSFPFFMLMIGLVMGLATGTSSRISRFLGEKEHAKAENTAMHGILFAVILAGILFVPIFFNLRTIFGLFGATGAVTELAISYMRIIMFGTFAMFPAFVINNTFSAQGDTTTPMKIQSISLILNIILDPIFIYALGMGVSGAALATAISFTVSLITGFVFLQTHSHLVLHPRHFRWNPAIAQDVLSVGFPTSLRMVIISLYMVFINRFASSFGTEHVAAIGISLRLESLVTMPGVAISIALMTLVGMFYGAKRYELVKDISLFALKVAVLFNIVMGVLFVLFSRSFIAIFTPDQLVRDIGALFLRIDVITFPFIAINIITSRIMQGVGKGIPGFIVNIIRVLVVAVPLAYVLVYQLGYGFSSIPWSLVVGGFIATCVSVFYLFREFKILDRMAEKEKVN
jgi:putative MATE family efflux protein